MTDTEQTVCQVAREHCLSSPDSHGDSASAIVAIRHRLERMSELENKVCELREENARYRKQWHEAQALVLPALEWRRSDAASMAFYRGSTYRIRKSGQRWKLYLNASKPALSTFKRLRDAKEAARYIARDGDLSNYPNPENK